MGWTLVSEIVGLIIVPAGIAVLVVGQTMAYRKEALQVEVDRAIRMLMENENIDAFFQKHPRSEPVYRVWCQLAVDQGIETPEATRRLALFRERFPRNETGLFWEAKRMRVRGEYAQAETFLAGILRSRPRDAALYLHYEHAELAEARSDTVEAGRRWRYVQSAFTKFPEGFLGEAALLTRSGDYAAAEGLVQQALLRDPKRHHSMAAYAEAAEHQGRWADAVERWQVFRSEADSNPQGYLRGMHACYRAGRTQEAERISAQIDTLFLRDTAALAERDQILAAVRPA